MASPRDFSDDLGQTVPYEFEGFSGGFCSTKPWSTVSAIMRVRAIRMAGKMASSSTDPPVKGKAEKKFLEIWFSDNTDPDSDFGKEVKQQLVALASKRLFEKVMAKAKNQETKAKAETLLKGLKDCLLPK